MILDPLLADMLRDRPRLLVVPAYHSWGGRPLRDLSGHNRTLTWASAVDNDRAMAVPPALRSHRTPWFSGSSKYFTDSASDTAMNVGTGDFAFEWWMLCTSSTSNYAQILGRDTGASGSYQLVYLAPTTGRLTTYVGGTSYNGSKKVSDGVIHHIVFQRRAGAVEHWIDGYRQDVFGAGGSVGGGTAFRFGLADGSYNHFQGWAGPISMYAKSLAPAAIRRRWQLGTAPRGARRLLAA